jgi:hypothetical protein
MAVIAINHLVWNILVEDLRQYRDANRPSQKATDHGEGRFFRTHPTIYQVLLTRWQYTV